MSFDAEVWLVQLCDRLKEIFQGRLVCVGLQGSQRRGEASDDSDVDAVVILDQLNFDDLKTYRRLVRSMPLGEKACGFIAGREELCRWERAELFQFYYDTKPLHGTLAFLLPLIGRADIERALRRGAGDVYHGCCHGYLFEDAAKALPFLLKHVFFTLQAKVFLERGVYAENKQALLRLLEPTDREILMLPEQIATAENTEFAYERLLRWSGDLLRRGGKSV